MQLGTGGLQAGLVRAGQAQLLTDELRPAVGGQRGGERGHRLQRLVPAPVDPLRLPGGAGGAVLDQAGDHGTQQGAQDGDHGSEHELPPQERTIGRRR
ncbi:hypothetical protein ACIQD1_31245 [Streptomyces sp. NPDC093088]|uniref:hypothetical protein n=1 Tax=Streptomyces sp. NPDC093088 TaxID=3366023 RepID=UPI003827633D